MLNNSAFDIIDTVRESLGSTFRVIRYLMIIGCIYIYIYRSSGNVWYSTACLFSMFCIGDFHSEQQLTKHRALWNIVPKRTFVGVSDLICSAGYDLTCVN